MLAPVDMLAPSRSLSSAICVDVRVVVPSSSAAIISACVPSASLGSLENPASKLTVIRIAGIDERCAKNTGIPFDKVVRSMAGKSSALRVPTSGGIRTGGLSSGDIATTGFGGGCVDGASPVIASISGDVSRVPGSMVRLKTGRPIHLRAAATTCSGVSAASSVSSFLYLDGSFE